MKNREEAKVVTHLKEKELDAPDIYCQINGDGACFRWCKGEREVANSMAGGLYVSHNSFLTSEDINLFQQKLITSIDQNKVMSKDHSYNSDFKYKHQNPYHDRLAEFSDFVFRDNDSEALRDLGFKATLKRKTNPC